MASSSLKIKDLKNCINSMCPIKIYINNELIWDDDKDDIVIYDEILKLDFIVKSIRFDICHFHHSIVYIKTDYALNTTKLKLDSKVYAKSES